VRQFWLHALKPLVLLLVVYIPRSDFKPCIFYKDAAVVRSYLLILLLATISHVSGCVEFLKVALCDLPVMNAVLILSLAGSSRDCPLTKKPTSATTT
jgi:hypothetical protein